MYINIPFRIASKNNYYMNSNTYTNSETMTTIDESQLKPEVKLELVKSL